MIQKVKIFAGVKRIRGTTKLTGVGRLCNWVPDQDQPLADEFVSFGSYQRTLTLECDHGEPGIVEWTPDQNTPDTVYYQVNGNDFGMSLTITTIDTRTDDRFSRRYNFFSATLIVILDGR